MSAIIFHRVTHSVTPGTMDCLLVEPLTIGSAKGLWCESQAQSGCCCSEAARSFGFGVWGETHGFDSAQHLFRRRAQPGHGDSSGKCRATSISLPAGEHGRVHLTVAS